MFLYSLSKLGTSTSSCSLVKICSTVRLAKTTPSSKEFEAKRFAPCTPVDDASPMT